MPPIRPSQFTWTPTEAQGRQTYTFGVRVTDDGPGHLYAERPVNVGVGYTWSGFLQPINQNGSSVFKLGQTIPVKFQLTGASAGVTDGNLFRYSDGQYIFNLSTDGLTVGTYQLRVDLGDGVNTRVVYISLR